MTELDYINAYLTTALDLGEDVSLSCEDTGRIRTLGPIADAIYSTGDAQVRVWRAGKRIGTLRFITNNGGPDVVLADWAAIPELDTALDREMERLAYGDDGLDDYNDHCSLL